MQAHSKQESKSETSLKFSINTTTHKSALYSGLADVNPDVKKIYQLLDENVNDPAVILQTLLEEYIKNSSFGPGRFLAGRLKHEKLAKEMQAALLGEEKSAADGSSKLHLAFNILNKAPDEFTLDDKFIRLLNAFFSIYPLFYFSYINNPQLIKNMHVILQEDIFFKTTLVPEAERHNKHAGTIVDENEIILINLAGKIETTIDLLIERLNFDSLSTEKSGHAYNALESLARIVRRVPREIVESKILPPILAVMRKDREWYTIKGTLFPILEEAAKKVGPESREEILAILAAELSNRKSDHGQMFACETFHAIAAQHRKMMSKQVEESIIPTLLQAKDNYGNDYDVYRALGDAAHFVAQKTFDDKILPSLVDVVKSGSISSAGCAAIFQVLTSACEAYTAMGSVDEYLKLLKDLKVLARQKLTVLVPAEEKDRKVDCYTLSQLSGLLPLFDLEQLQGVVFPFILKAMDDKDPHVVRVTYEILRQCANLPGSLLFREFGTKMIDILFERLKIVDYLKAGHIHSTLAKLVKVLEENQERATHIATSLLQETLFCEKASSLREVFESFKEVTAYFANDQEATSRVEAKMSDKETNGIKLKYLSVLVAKLDPVFIQKNIFPKLIEALKNGIFYMFEEAILVLQEAVKKVDISYLKKLFPGLLRVLATDSVRGKSLIPIVNEAISNQLSYPERVHCSRMLVKAFESDSSDDRRNYEFILGHIYAQNMAEMQAARLINKAAVLNKHKQTFSCRIS